MSNPVAYKPIGEIHTHTHNQHRRRRRTGGFDVSIHLRRVVVSFVGMSSAMFAMFMPAYVAHTQTQAVRVRKLTAHLVRPRRRRRDD